MSTADDAWQEWREEIHGPIGEFRDSPMTTKKTAFMAGYRRALEDAADALQVIADGIPRTETDSNAYARMCAYDNAAKTCRDRAAGVGTKDEPLFACCGEWHSGPPCPCRCGHAYEQHTDSIGCVDCKGGSCVKYEPVGTKDGDDDE